MERGEIPEAFCKFLGDDRYTKFLRVLEERTTESKDLHFWQAAAWEKFALANGLSIPSTIQEIAPLFRRQGPPRLTRERFMTRPSESYLESPDVPADWVRDAWHADSAFRENLVYAVVRSVSKIGGLG